MTLDQTSMTYEQYIDDRCYPSSRTASQNTADLPQEKLSVLYSLTARIHDFKQKHSQIHKPCEIRFASYQSQLEELRKQLHSAQQLSSRKERQLTELKQMVCDGNSSIAKLAFKSIAISTELDRLSRKCGDLQQLNSNLSEKNKIFDISYQQSREDLQHADRKVDLLTAQVKELQAKLVYLQDQNQKHILADHNKHATILIETKNSHHQTIAVLTQRHQQVKRVLQQRIAGLLADLQKIETKNSELEENLLEGEQNSTRKIAELKIQLQRMDLDYQHAQKHGSSLQEKLKNTTEEFQKEISSLNDEISSLKSLVAKQELNLTALKDQHQIESINLEQQITTLKRRLSEQHKHIEEQDVKLNKLRTTLIQLQTEHERCNARKNQIEVDQRQLASEHALMRQRYHSRERQLKQLNEDKNKVQGQLDLCRQQKNQCKSELIELRQQLKLEHDTQSKQSIMLENTSKKMCQLQDQIEYKRKKLEQKSVECAELHVKLEACMHEKGKLEQQLTQKQMAFKINQVKSTVHVQSKPCQSEYIDRILFLENEFNCLSLLYKQKIKELDYWKMVSLGEGLQNLKDSNNQLLAQKIILLKQNHALKIQAQAASLQNEVHLQNQKLLRQEIVGLKKMIGEERAGEMEKVMEQNKMVWRQLGAAKEQLQRVYRYDDKKSDEFLLEVIQHYKIHQ